MPGFTACKRWHVDFITKFLKVSVSPEDGYKEGPNLSVSIRKQLFRFLLHHPMTEDLWDLNSSSKDLVSDRPAPHTVAAVLVSLAQRSCGLIGLVSYKEPEEEPLEEDDVAQKLKNCEHSYLSGSFELPFSPTKFDVAPETKSKQSHLEKPLANLEDDLLSVLGECARTIAEHPDEEVVKSLTAKDQVLRLHNHLNLQSSCCSVLVGVFGLLGVCKGEGVSQGHCLLALARQLLNELESGLRNAVWSLVDVELRHSLVADVITNLVPLVTTSHLHGNSQEAVKVHYEILQVIFPESLVELIGDVAQGKWFPASVDGCQGKPCLNWSQQVSMQDPIDVDLMDVSHSTQTRPTELEGGGVREIGRAGQTKEVLSSSSVDSCDRSVLAAVEMLVEWVRDAVADGDGVMFTGLLGTVRHVLLSMLRCEKLDLKRPVGVQVVMRCARLLKTRELCGDDVEAILERIGDLLMIHPRDPFVAAHSLSVMQLCTHHFSKTSSDGIVDLCENLMKAFMNLHSDGHLPPLVRLRFVECCHSMLQAEKKGARLSIFSQDNSEEDHVKGIFLSILADSDHVVRMKMSTLVAVLFVDTSDSVKTSHEQAFAAVKQILGTSTGKQQDIASLDEDSQSDESFNLMSSCLTTFQTIACVSPICECKVILTIFNALGGGLVEVEMVDKMLSSTVSHLGYTSKGAFLSRHMTSIVSKWLTDKFDITAFPCKLFDETTLRDFFLRYTQQVIPCLVWACDKDALLRVSEICGTTPSNLVRDCVPRCMLVVMTTYACQKGQQGVSDSQLQQASSCHDLLVDFFQEKGVSDQLLESMNDFIVCLLSSAHEDSQVQSEYSKYFRACDPEPDFPHFSSHQIRLTLSYMSQCYGGNSTLIANLVKTKDSLQSILLSLSLLLSAAHHCYAKQRILVGYFIFVRLILDDLTTGLNGTSLYIIHSVVHTVLHLCDQLLPLCCDILLDVVKRVFVVAPHELGIHIPHLFSSLLPYTDPHIRGSEAVVDLLSFLLTHCSGEDLRQYWTTVDIVPSSGPARTLMDQLRQLTTAGDKTLKEVIASFKTKWRAKCPISHEELQYIRTALKDNQQALVSMISKGPMDPDHLACVSLVQQLFSLGRGCHSFDTSCHSDSSGSHGDVLTECARCLGVLGVFNLKQLSLPSLADDDADLLKVLQLKQNEVHAFKVLRLLSQLLIDKDVQVVDACSSSLKSLLQTSLGESVLSKILHHPISSALEWSRYLEPFRGKKLRKVSTSKPTCSEMGTGRAEGLNSAYQTELWYPWQLDQKKTYKKWLTELTVALLLSGSVQDRILVELPQLCSVKLEVAELVFPFVLYDIVVSGSEEHSTRLSHCVRDFFNLAIKLSPSNQQAVSAVISVVMYLRTIPLSGKSRSQCTSWSSNFWFDLDYLVVSKAALSASLPVTSLLCVEIAIGHWMSSPGALSVPDDDIDDDSWSEDYGCLETTNRFLSQGILASDVHAQLVDIYSSIGESDCLDGVYAIFGSSENIQSNKCRMYEHEGNWLGALGSYVHELGESSSAPSGVRKAVHNLGWHKLNRYLSLPVNQAQDAQMQLSEYHYEAVWRTTQWSDDWDFPSTSSATVGGSSFSQHICSAIAALRSQDQHLLKDAVHGARSAVLSRCLVTSEKSTTIYPVLSKLQCLTEIEELASVLFGDSPLQDVLLSWQHRLIVMDANYSYTEPVLALRCTLLRFLLSVAKQQDCNQREDYQKEIFVALRSTLVQQADRARKACQFQVAESATFSLCQLMSSGTQGENPTPPGGLGEAPTPTGALGEDLIWETEWICQLQQAQLHWSLGEKQFALHTLRSLTASLSKVHKTSPSAALLYPSVLCLHGNWLAEMRAENPNIILKKYLLKAVDFIGDVSTNQKLLEGCVLPVERAYTTLARYADLQYQNITRHMLSSSFEAKKSLLKKAKEEAEEVSKLAAQKSNDPKRCQSVLRQLKKHSEQDQAELKSVLQDKTTFLHIAVKNYILSIKSSDEDNLCVFRLCSLWFDNSQDEQVNELFQKETFESRKFLPMLYQLAARMSELSKETVFQQVLRKLIYNVSRDHPHHSLYILLAMHHAPKDEEYPPHGYQCGSKKGKLKRSSSAASSSQAVDMDKVRAAGSLVRQLSSTHSELVQSVVKLCDAYIELAYHDTSVAGRCKTGVYPMPAASVLARISKLRTVAVPTVDIPIDPTCRYDNIVYINGFDQSFRVEGGVNAPKVVSCIGSDGLRRRQLIKGRDDLRQDAVMQQVFGLVNLLLRRDTAATRRKLHIRTYNVIPLSQRSGVVEWCEGTVPFGIYLVHPKEGAHVRYNPRDWPNNLCRKKMEEVSSKNKEQKMKAFKNVMENFKPVLRHFFFEKFSSPVQWFERRLAYTRSVATSSIVGYILGLGDRHVQNILIDTNMAEVIHIDLGVAFEQGKTLPTPETIPFRLTRDVIDGMGVTGVEGVFRRSCEVTLNTMKASKEEVKTIVEVLLHDPLYMWTIRTLQIQKDTDIIGTYASDDILAELDSLATTQREGSVSKMADRALLRLQEKLDGYEEGVGLSTSGHINYLIQSATDIRNLSCLFPGWQPWI
jgi:ataxia telangiectasia mutated family protein